MMVPFSGGSVQLAVKLLSTLKTVKVICVSMGYQPT